MSEDVFTVSKNIKGVKLRARATGELIAKSLNLEATLKKASATSKTSGNGGSNGGGTTPTGGDSNTGGSQSQGGSGSSQSGGESQNGGTNGGTNGGSQNGGSGSNTGGNSGSQSGTEQGQEGDYRLVIYKYGNGTSTVTDDSEQEINSPRTTEPTLVRSRCLPRALCWRSTPSPTSGTTLTRTDEAASAEPCLHELCRVVTSVG